MTFKAFTLIGLFPLFLQGMEEEEETTQLVPDGHYSINSHRPHTERAPHEYCSNASTHYSCAERVCCALPALTTTFCCLGMREVASDCIWVRDQTTSFAQAHTQVWCSRDAWFPWLCDTKQETCASITVNCSTGITIASVAYALCVFLPCITKKGCTFRKVLENTR